MAFAWRQITQEPLEEHALKDTRFAVEPLGITAWESLLLEPRPEAVGAVNDALGEGRGDTSWRRPDTPTLALEVRVPFHCGTPHGYQTRGRSRQRTWAA